jgi:hypothetical protein
VNHADTTATERPASRSNPLVSEVADPLRDLLAHLTDLHATLRQLTDLSQHKLELLRAADADGLQSCAARESELLHQVFHAAQARGAVLARLAQSMQIEELRSLRLGRICERLPEPQASVLRARITALEETAGLLQRKNQLAATVAQNLQSHIRGVFAELAKATQECTGYGPHGMPETSSERCWVDAVG